jgi:hypothetical protein
MADTAVSLTAIIVSGVVGPSLSAWWTRRRQRDDHERELRAELAAVLDEGANALGQASRCYGRIHLLYRTGVDCYSTEAREAFADRRRTMQDVRYVGDRIAIRLGVDHPVHRAFAQCVETLDQRRDFARAYERGSVSDATYEEQRRARDQYDPTRQTFVEAARQLVGPRLH